MGEMVEELRNRARAFLTTRALANEESLEGAEPTEALLNLEGMSKHVAYVLASRGITDLEKLASDIGTTVDRLVGQFKDAGIVKSAGAQINEEEKQKLLDHLSKQHGSSAEPTRMTLKRKTTSTLSVGKSKEVKVEVRKKRTYVKRSDVEEQQRQAEEEAKRLEEEARLKREAEEKAAAEAKKAAEEKARKAQEAKKAAEEERARRAEQAKKEAEARKADEPELTEAEKAEAEAARQEEERLRKAQEEEAQKKLEEDAKKAAEEKARKAQEATLKN